MPTEERWLESTIAMTTWQVPLVSNDLRQSFANLVAMIDEKQDAVHVLFDISNWAASRRRRDLAINSGFLTHANTGKVAVVGMQHMAQLFAQIAVRATSKDIVFFAEMDAAIEFLNRAEEEAPAPEAP